MHGPAALASSEAAGGASFGVAHATAVLARFLAGDENAFVLDIALVLFYLPYAFFYNLAYDTLGAKLKKKPRWGV